jgi:hypothetical protein
MSLVRRGIRKIKRVNSYDLNNVRVKFIFNPLVDKSVNLSIKKLNKADYTLLKIYVVN